MLRSIPSPRTDISENYAEYVIPLYCVGDLLAKFTSGIVIDSKLISWQGVLALGYTIEVSFPGIY